MGCTVCQHRTPAPPVGTVSANCQCQYLTPVPSPPHLSRRSFDIYTTAGASVSELRSTCGVCEACHNRTPRPLVVIAPPARRRQTIGWWKISTHPHDTDAIDSRSVIIFTPRTYLLLNLNDGGSRECSSTRHHRDASPWGKCPNGCCLTQTVNQSVGHTRTGASGPLAQAGRRAPNLPNLLTILFSGRARRTPFLRLGNTRNGIISPKRGLLVLVCSSRFVPFGYLLTSAT